MTDLPKKDPVRLEPPSFPPMAPLGAALVQSIAPTEITRAWAKASDLQSKMRRATKVLEVAGYITSKKDRFDVEHVRALIIAAMKELEC